MILDYKELTAKIAAMADLQTIEMPPLSDSQKCRLRRHLDVHNIHVAYTKSGKDRNKLYITKIP